MTTCLTVRGQAAGFRFGMDGYQYPTVGMQCNGRGGIHGNVACRDLDGTCSMTFELGSSTPSSLDADLNLPDCACCGVED